MPSLIKSALRIGLTVALVVILYQAYAAPHNGFDLSNSSIDISEIMYGGPEKDGIPAIDNPKFIRAENNRSVKAGDRILGIHLEGISKAYPIGILNWHEIVNDEIRGQKFSVTYCPLCGTGIAFSSEVGDKNLDFGVSGLLYNSDVLLYDRQTESLWSQIISEAISGPMQGHRLKRIKTTHTSWGDWLKQHPDTLLLSEDTGFSRDYQRDPYDGYEQSRATYFQITHEAPPNYHPKERVLGVEINNQFKAYPFTELDRSGKKQIQDTFANQQLTLHWDRKNSRADIRDHRGKPLAAIEGFWFAWFTFHPDTEVFKASP